MAKYFEYLNGGAELPREFWLTVGIYADSAEEGAQTLLRVLFSEMGEPAEGSGPPPTVRDFELQNERALADDEAPSRIIYGTAPNGFVWERSY
jgi:hypothetical protein